MASTLFTMGPSNYGRHLAINRIFGNPSGMALPSPALPLYLALFYTTADPDSGATITEVSVTGYSRQLYHPVIPFRLSDGGTYDIFNSGSYKTANSVAINFGPLISGGIVLKGVAVVDSPIRGAGNILFWADFINWPHPASGDTVSFPVGTAGVECRRGIYFSGAAPGLISYFLSQQLADVAYDGVTPTPPIIKMALYEAQGDGTGADPLDPDSYPKPVPNPFPIELTDPGYARAPFTISSIDPPAQTHGDTVWFCKFTGELCLFGPFVTDQTIGGFALVNEAIGSSIMIHWNDFHPVLAGSGVVIDGRAGWEFGI